MFLISPELSPTPITTKSVTRNTRATSHGEKNDNSLLFKDLSHILAQIIEMSFPRSDQGALGSHPWVQDTPVPGVHRV